jgi:hypothetical protein
VVVGVLFAHPATWPETRIKTCVDFLNGWLRDQSTPTRRVIANVHSARTEWYRHYANGMDMKEWAKHALTRTSPVLGTQQYRLVVVPGTTCGSVTSIIVAEAMRLGLPVKAMIKTSTGAVALRPVEAVTVKDVKDQEAGWLLTLKD